MTLAMNVHLLPISSIQVDRAGRQREVIEVEDLAKSIARNGLINPIVVRGDGFRGVWLVAGERRLEACRSLGHETILARFVSDLAPVELAILELEENIKRRDLDWKDMTRAVARVHDLHRAQDPDWTAAETAEALSISAGQVSLYLRVRTELGQGGRVDEAGTAREAYNMIARKDQRVAGQVLEDLLSLGQETAADGAAATKEEEPATGPRSEPSNPIVIDRSIIPPTRPRPEEILCASFLDWAPRYSGQKFNLVHCDFPYGIQAFSGSQMRGAEPQAEYSDREEVYWALLDRLLTHLDRLMSLSGHLVFWYSERHGARTRECFARRAPSLEFTAFPLIWLKSDNAGVAPGSRRGPRHVYETALLASRGDRNVVKIMADAYAAPTDKRLHPSCKPEPMLRHFLAMLVDEHTRMLDPTCGSGSSLRAADSLGAQQVLGLEIDPGHCEGARVALRNARMLRGAGA